MTTFSLDMAEDDENPPMPGDLLTTERLVYLITDSREVDSRVWCNRWKLRLERLGPKADLVDIRHRHPEGRIRSCSRYAKGETPTEFFARQRDASPG